MEVVCLKQSSLPPAQHTVALCVRSVFGSLFVLVCVCMSVCVGPCQRQCCCVRRQVLHNADYDGSIETDFISDAAPPSVPRRSMLAGSAPGAFSATSIDEFARGLPGGVAGTLPGGLPAHVPKKVRPNAGAGAGSVSGPRARFSRRAASAGGSQQHVLATRRWHRLPIGRSGALARRGRAAGRAHGRAGGRALGSRSCAMSRSFVKLWLWSIS